VSVMDRVYRMLGYEQWARVEFEIVAGPSGRYDLPGGPCFYFADAIDRSGNRFVGTGDTLPDALRHLAERIESGESK
jgi:hypothetical protein